MSGDNKTTQTSTNEPYKAAKPLLDKGMGDALNLYKNNQLAPVNTSSTVVPYSQQTMQGMNSIQGTANEALAPGGFASQFKDIIGQGGFNDPQMAALDQTRQLATGSYDVNANPGFQNVLDSVLQKAGTGVNQNAAAMGRYGSGTHQGVMQQTQGDIANRMISDDYNRWLGRRDNANTQLFGMGQTGMDNLNPAYASLKAPAEDLMGVGSMYEDLMGRQMNDQLRITSEKQNQQANAIRELLGFAAGAGNLGTQTQTAQGPSSSLSNTLGYGLGGASLLSGLL
jgi:hypothetical protein